MCLYKGAGEREDARCQQLCLLLSISSQVPKYSFYPMCETFLSGLEMTEGRGGDNKRVCFTLEDIKMVPNLLHLQLEQHLTNENTTMGFNLS